MTAETATPPPASPPRTAYLRSVTFLDYSGDAETDPAATPYPVHVTARVLFDGQPAPVGILGWEVESRKGDAAHLYLDVDSAAVTTDPAAEDPRLAYKLGDFPVLVPADVDTDDDGAIVSRTPTLWRDNGDGTHSVAIFVESVHMQPHTFGDRATDGGMQGTIVRCYECGGTGQLHQPDDDDPLTESP